MIIYNFNNNNNNFNIIILYYNVASFVILVFLCYCYNDFYKLINNKICISEIKLINIIYLYFFNQKKHFL